MRRWAANWCNERGRAAAANGDRSAARAAYRQALRFDPTWSVPWYNLGLEAKYQGHWDESRRCNLQATNLDPQDEAAWWNLGIAATALCDWKEARRAWKQVGAPVPEGDDEWVGPPEAACVRLNPAADGEVVWGERIDPARILILNIPLAESKHRFRDIVLNDGAPRGTRTRDGVRVPVFDELAIWRASDYSTYRSELKVPNERADQALIDLCDAHGLGIEDWSTVRWMCAECSRGDPGPHDCAAQAHGDARLHAFAARTELALTEMLNEWRTGFEGASYSAPELVMTAGR